MSRALAALFICCCLLHPRLLAEGRVYRRGDWVTVTVPNTSFRGDGRSFGHAQLGDSYCVGEQRGDWLWIPSANGSLSAAEVVPYLEAPEFFTKAIERNPDDPWAYFVRAVFFSKSKAPNRALADADRAIELSHDRAEFYICRGNILRTLGQYEKSAADFEIALRLDPHDINCWNGRGLARNELMQYEGAIEDFNRAIDLNPNASFLWSNRGLAYTGLRRFERAVSDFSTAIAFAPNDPVPLRNRADARWHSGQWAAAFADYDAALALPTARNESYLARGDRLMEIGFYREALTDYAAAIRHDLLGSDAFAARGWLLATCPDPQYRDPHQALLDGKLACDRTDFRNAHALRTYAAALADHGRFEEAVKWQNAATRLANYRYDTWYRRVAGYYGRKEPYRQSRPTPRPPVEAIKPEQAQKTSS